MPASIEITKQLALFLDNRPGTLARVCDALSAAKINIFAITTSDTVDHSVIRMVLSDTRKAIDVFEAHGSLVVEDDVLMLAGDNRPGSLAVIAHKFTQATDNEERLGQVVKCLLPGGIAKLVVDGELRSY